MVELQMNSEGSQLVFLQHFCLILSEKHKKKFMFEILMKKKIRNYKIFHM